MVPALATSSEVAPSATSMPATMPRERRSGWSSVMRGRLQWHVTPSAREGLAGRRAATTRPTGTEWARGHHRWTPARSREQPLEGARVEVRDVVEVVEHVEGLLEVMPGARPALAVGDPDEREAVDGLGLLGYLLVGARDLVELGAATLRARPRRRRGRRAPARRDSRARG